MIETVQKEWKAKIAVGLFLILSLWWVVNNFIIGNSNISYDSFVDFGEFYGYMALLGGVWGVMIAQKWGGFKSVMGKAVMMFSLGLFAQEFGQLFYAWYNNIYKVAGPYPSIGDIGYFGSVLLYIAGVIFLAQAAGVKIRPKLFFSNIQAVIIPLAMLSIGYFLFLKKYEFDWGNPLKIFLDFGYPFGQAIYISLAILTYILSRGVLGGIMKNRILFLLFALVVQFLADYTFLYQSSHGTWEVGGSNDYIYFVAYFSMTLALIQFESAYKKLMHE
jgi:hypothetical protein